MKKKIIILILSIFILFLIVSNDHVKKTSIFASIKTQLSKILSVDVQTFLRIVSNSDGNLFEHYNNDYLVNFLPETQFIKNLDVKRVKLKFLKKTKYSYKYSFEIIDEHLIIATNDGQLRLEKIDNIINNAVDQINFEKLKTNLDDLFAIESLHSLNVTDIFIDNGNIYLLAHVKKDNCKEIYLLSGSFNLNSINFKKIFSTKSIIECLTKDTNAGRIQISKIDEKKNFWLPFLIKL